MFRRLYLTVVWMGACLLGLALLLTGDVARGGRALAGGVGEGRETVGEPQWGPDIRVNPPVTATPARQTNFSMAVNPTAPYHVITGWSTTNPGSGTSAYGWSTDGGRTWGGGVFTGPWGSGEPLTPLGDANVAFDANGVGYYTSLAIGSTMHGYFVLTTTNGSEWSAPVPIVVSDYSESRSFTDLAADPRASGPLAGSLYLVWQRTLSSNPPYDGIRMRYSRDGGATWSSDVRISDQGHEYSYGPQATVASNGTVYAAFQQLDNGDIFNSPRLYLDRSTDSGITWGPDRLITGGPLTYIGRPDFKFRELTLPGSAVCNLMRVNHYPSLAVSPGDPNTVYVVWNDGRWESPFSMCGVMGRHSDIAFSRSTDGGLSWTAPARLNDDPIDNHVDQFQPTIAVRADGLLGVTWHDRRYDPNGYLFDIDYTQSTDGGLTWSANSRVSDVSSDPDKVLDYKTIGDVGYRNALVYGPDYVLPSWIDTRLGDRQGDFFTDHGVFVAATSTPTATPTATTTSTSTRTATSTPSPTRSLTATSTPTPSITPSSSPTFTPPLTPTGTRAATFTPTPTGTRTQTPTGTPPVTPTFTPTSTSTARPTSTPTLTATSTLTRTATPPATATGTTATATVTPTPCPMSFSDVLPADWFYEFVRYLYCRGAISGYGDGTFKPYNNTTRGQLCKIVVLGFGQTIYTPPAPTFRDVPANDVFYPFVETAYHNNLVTGYSCGGACLEFRPGNLVTRGQLSKIVVIAAGWPLLDPPEGHFSDVPPGNVFYRFVETAFDHGIISGYGDNTFKPGNNATRAQISKIVTLALSSE